MEHDNSQLHSLRNLSFQQKVNRGRRVSFERVEVSKSNIIGRNGFQQSDIMPKEIKVSDLPKLLPPYLHKYVFHGPREQPRILNHKDDDPIMKYLHRLLFGKTSNEHVVI